MKRLIAFALFSAALAGLIAIERCTSDRSVTSVDAGFLYLNDDAGMWYCGNDGGLPCPNFYTTDIQTETPIARCVALVAEEYGRGLWLRLVAAELARLKP